MSQKPQTLSYEALEKKLDGGAIVPLTAVCWEELRSDYTIRDEIPTGMSGVILLIRREKRKPGWAIVEESEPKVRVVRPLPSEKEARALIADRLAAYERMWDG